VFQNFINILKWLMGVLENVRLAPRKMLMKIGKRTSIIIGSTIESAEIANHDHMRGNGEKKILKNIAPITF